MSIGTEDIPIERVRKLMAKSAEEGKEVAFSFCAPTDDEMGSRTRVEAPKPSCDMVGVVHTHPGGKAEFSQADRQALNSPHIDMLCVGVPEDDEVKCEIDESADGPEVEKLQLNQEQQAAVLNLLPKGSECEGYKSVPSRSDYHDSDQVDRCSSFEPPWGNNGEESDDDQEETDSREEKKTPEEHTVTVTVKEKSTDFRTAMGYSFSPEIEGNNGLAGKIRSKANDRIGHDNLSDYEGETVAEVTFKGGNVEEKRVSQSSDITVETLVNPDEIASIDWKVEPADDDQDSGAWGTHDKQSRTPDEIPEGIKGWYLRRSSNGVVSYVTEGEVRHLVRKGDKNWGRTANTVSYLTVKQNDENDYSVYATRENTDNSRKDQIGKLTKNDTDSWPDVWDAIRAARHFMETWDEATRRFSPSKRINGFHRNEVEDDYMSYVRGEIPDQEDYDKIKIHANWNYEYEEAERRPVWAVEMVYYDGGEIVKTIDRNTYPHHADAFDRMESLMSQVSFKFDFPESVGDWQLESERQERLFIYRLDLNEDVLTIGGDRKPFYKYLHGRSTVKGWEIDVKKGFEDDDMDDREKITELGPFGTQVGAGQAAVSFMEEQPDAPDPGDEIEFPDEVNGWEVSTQDHDVGFSRDEEIVSWESKDGESWVYVAESASTSRTADERWKTGVDGENTTSINLSDYEDVSDAVDRCVSYMESTEPDKQIAKIDLKGSNSTFKQISNLIWAVGGSGHSGNLAKADGDSLTIQSQALASTGLRVTVPQDSEDIESFQVDQEGSVAFDQEAWVNSYRDQKKSETASLRVYDDEDYGLRMECKAGEEFGGDISGSQRHSSAKTPYSFPREWPGGDLEESGTIEAPARELKKWIEAVRIILGDDTSGEPVLIGMSGDSAQMVIETEEERAKAPIKAIEEDAKVSGEGQAVVSVDGIYDMIRKVPKPASTVVTMTVFENSHIVARFQDAGVTYEMFIMQMDEIPDYSLSRPIEETGLKTEHNGATVYLDSSAVPSEREVIEDTEWDDMDLFQPDTTDRHSGEHVCKLYRGTIW